MRRAVVCAPLLPEFDRESGSRRIFDTIVLLQDAGWAVSVVAENGRGGDRYVRLLAERGIPTYCGLGARVEQLFAAGHLDLAVFAFWDFAERLIPTLRRLSPETRVIVDTIDLHFVRNARRLFQASMPGEAALDTAYADEMRRELNVYGAADGVLAVSQKEADLINDLLGDASLAHVAPDCEDLELSPVPFADRKGILFIGNFRHPPNVQAAEFLCREVAPRVARNVLKRHPLYIVGNGMTDKIRNFARDVPNVKLVGWVPSVVPYLQRCRISVVPLLHGAGTKRKLVQSLMSGTPAVSTTVGVEGLGLTDGRDVLVADDANWFASAVERLLDDEPLWQDVATAAREQIVNTHSREAARVKWNAAITAIMARPPKRPPQPPDVLTGDRWTPARYRSATRLIRDSIRRVVPRNSTVLVVSKGDEELVRLKGVKAWHFPQGEDGGYLGHYPADSATAIRHLEALRRKGGQYLLLPGIALWWLDHYRKFKDHLDRHYSVVFSEPEMGVLYCLDGASSEESDPAVRLDTIIT